MLVEQTLQPAAGLPEIPAVGMRMELPLELENLEWYGRGPEENYWDRNTGSFVGIYRCRVEDRFFPYIRPQETGNATDVRWASLTNSQGTGLAILGDPVVEVNALLYAPEELERRRHPYELVSGDSIVLRVNQHQMGVGGDNSWGARPHASYSLPSTEPYTVTFRWVPITPSRPSPMQLKRQRVVP